MQSWSMVAATLGALGQQVVESGVLGVGFNAPPSIRSSLMRDASVLNGDELAFVLTVEDPEGDPLSLRMLNPPTGLAFPSVLEAPSPLRIELRWRAELRSNNTQEWVFEASDGKIGVPSRFVQRFHVLGQGPPTFIGFLFEESPRVADIGGDGILDLLFPDTLASPHGVSRGGAITLWHGSATLAHAPRAVLLSTQGRATQGNTAGAFTTADVDGDTFQDILALVVDTPSGSGGGNGGGAIRVWSGGPDCVGERAPLCFLSSGPHNLGAFPSGSGTRMLAADVTGDGIDDVLAPASLPELGVLVWWGGRALAGTRLPDAVLRGEGQTGAVGFPLNGQTFAVADLTGDGILDVVGSDPRRSLPGRVEAGALFTWEGGAGLIGSPAPIASLLGSQSQAFLGAAGGAAATGWRLEDVTGDTVADVVVRLDDGHLGVLVGGASLRGATQPTFLLDGSFGPGAVRKANPLNVSDVSGDGIADVLMAFHDGGVAARVSIWKGGALLGPAPDAILSATESPALAPLLALGDVTGDGVNDVLLGGPRAPAPGAPFGPGRIDLFAGGEALLGNPLPFATLDPAGGGGLFPEDAWLRDVSGDGVLDILVLDSTREHGVVYLWLGSDPGSFESEALVLRPPEVPGAGLVLRTLAIGDVTGDGVADVLGHWRALFGAPQTGLLVLWEGARDAGGWSAAGRALRVLPSGAPSALASPMDRVVLADATGDGVLDVVSHDMWASLRPATQPTRAGTTLLWDVARAPAGDPLVALRLANPAALDRDGDISSAVACDLTGDGRVELVVVQPRAHVPQAPPSMATPALPNGSILIFGAPYVSLESSTAVSWPGGDSRGPRSLPVLGTAPAPIAPRVILPFPFLR